MKGLTLKRGSSLHFPIIVLSQVVVFSLSHAQIVMDTSFGRSGGAVPKISNNYDITDSLGKTVGNNLFHSFSQFDLVNGDVATFSGPANIQNILSRITGANASSIDGTIRSTIDGANMFFMNPHGVIFGQHAQLEVSGSFVATTADYIKLADGARFVAALDADDSALSTAPASAFGFLGSNPGPISVQQGSLSVPNGKSFSMIGGDISVDGGRVQAPSGRINLVSVKSAGEVSLDITDPAALPDTGAFSQQGQIDLMNGAKADTSGQGGGQVVIRGGKLVMNGGSIQADTSGPVDGKGVDVVLTEDLTMSDGAIMSASTTGSGNAGNITVTADSVHLDGGGLTAGILADSIGQTGKGGDITVNAHSLDIRNGARISSATSGPADGGSILLTADSILLDAQGSPRLTGIAVSTLLGVGGGNAGSIVVNPGQSGLLSLEILNGAVIAADTFGTGAGGKIDVTASSIRLDMQSSIFFTGIRARTFQEDSGGPGGDITITTGTLDMFNGAGINVQTRGSGASGNINITADAISLNSSSKINANTDGLGPGGSIELAANSLRMDGSSQIIAANDSGVEGDSPAGDIVIMRGNSGGLSIQMLNGSEISASSKGDSDGGRISLDATTLTLDNSAAIRTSTIGNGVAGDINLSLAESLTLLNQSELSASAPFSTGGNINIEAGSTIQVVDSGISALAGQLGGNVTLKAGELASFLRGTLSAQSTSGNGGNIVIDPPLVVLNQSQVNATAPLGRGGNITITADSQINLLDSTLSTSAGDNGGNITIGTASLVLNGGSIAADILGVQSGGRAGNIVIGPGASGGLSVQLLNGAEISASTKGASDGGSVAIDATDVTLNNHASIQCSTVGSGQAGNISLTVRDTLRLENNSDISVPAASQDGGNITLAVGKLIYLLNSSLTASAGDNGGNIRIDPVFLVLDNSSIHADAVNNNGGNVNVTADFFLRSDSPITADSEFGNPGTVLIQAIELDLTGSLVSLPGSLLGAESQLRQWCGARLAGGISTFLVLGKGGVSIGPDGPLPSFGVGPLGSVAR